MKFFVDTADVDDIRELNALGLVDGVTTNPSLILKSGRDIIEVTKEICGIVDGPVSAEVAATEYDQIMKEAAVLGAIADNICIKLPLTLDGLRACKSYNFKTEILVASIRSVSHVKIAALIGADVSTIPPSTLKALVKHPLTDKGLAAFLADWEKTGQDIAG